MAEQIIALNNNRRAQQLLLDFHVTQFKQAIPKCHDTFGFSCACLSMYSFLHHIHPHFSLLWAPNKELESHSLSSCRSHPASASASSQSLESPCTSTSSSGDSPDAFSAIITDTQGKRLEMAWHSVTFKQSGGTSIDERRSETKNR